MRQVLKPHWPPRTRSVLAGSGDFTAIRREACRLRSNLRQRRYEAMLENPGTIRNRLSRKLSGDSSEFGRGQRFSPSGALARAAGNWPALP
jgi:hypothetical protein